MPFIFEAARDGNVAEVFFFIEKGLAQALDVHEENALMIASRHDHLECVEKLIPVSDLSAKNESGETAFIIAAEHGSLHCLKRLMPLCDLEAKDNNGLNALLHAAKSGHLEALKVLKDGCDVNALDSNGENNALMWSAWMGRLECVQEILSWPDTQVHHANEMGLNPLMAAACAGHSKCVEVLLKTLEVNAKDAYGDTALMFAVSNDKVDCVKALWPHADATWRNQRGMSAFEVALEQESWAVIEWLLPRVTVLEIQQALCSPAFNRAPSIQEHLSEYLKSHQEREQLWGCIRSLDAPKKPSSVQKL